jgi:hypothetical protein
MGAEEAAAVNFDRFTSAEQQQVMANAERVRRLVPPGDRAERTDVVYDTAAFMLNVPVWDEQIVFAFQVMAWARENQ